MYSSHFHMSSSIFLMLGSLNFPSSSSASHRHLNSELYKFGSSLRIQLSLYMEFEDEYIR